MFWLILFALVIAVSIIGVIYMLVAIGRFSLIARIDKKWMRAFLAFVIIGVCGAVITFLLTYTDAIIVFLHVVCFFLIYGLIFRIIKGIRKKEFKIYWQGWLAIATSVIYLSIGYYLCNNVWQTDYNLTTDKNI
ncbi:MAG: serine/threonine protein phosphatase, partial [Lachnospiraceae bacterium]|nr:serine/threonine protein phosphatase [Lachnospiraceae bacterium]